MAFESIFDIQTPQHATFFGDPFDIFPAAAAAAGSKRVLFYVPGVDVANPFTVNTSASKARTNVMYWVSKYTLIIPGNLADTTRKKAWQQPPNFWILRLAMELRREGCQISVLGFSRGGFYASLYLGFEPGLFASVAIVAGYPNPAPAGSQTEQAEVMMKSGPSVLWIHSTTDECCPPQAYTTFFQRASELGLKLRMLQGISHAGLYERFIKGAVSPGSEEDVLRELHAHLGG